MFKEATDETLHEIKGGITAVPGIKASGISGGIKKAGKDLVLIISEPMAAAAGVFTQNVIRAAPVDWCAGILPSDKIKGIIINSGNANACTGKQGKADCKETALLTAKILNVSLNSLLVCSTGVIGRFLPMEKIRKAIPAIVRNLSDKSGPIAAEAILTTDTFAKVCAVEYLCNGRKVRIGAMAKGSGMIHVNVATMLGFITTNLAIDKKLLADALTYAVDRSFNLISVDGDTSTNDSVICLANGLVGNKKIVKKGKDFSQFVEALTYVCLKLAKMIVKDGEGATKFVEINIDGAATFEQAKKVGFAIARSSLVKTAFHGEDPNWGRIIAAAGTAGINFDPQNISLSFDRTVVFNNGTPVLTNPKVLRKILQKKEFQVNLNINQGKEKVTIYTCDLSYAYVKINAHYTT